MGYYIGLDDVLRLTPTCAMYNCDFPELPQTQALFSSTFLPPPLDGSLTLNEIYDWHLENNPEHRLFVCAREGALSRVIHWGETGMAVRRGAQMVSKMVGSRLDAVKQPVVAILAVSGIMLPLRGRDASDVLSRYGDLLDNAYERHEGELHCLSSLNPKFSYDDCQPLDGRRRTVRIARSRTGHAESREGCSEHHRERRVDQHSTGAISDSPV